MTDKYAGIVALKPCPKCKQKPGTKVGPPALARCVNPDCEGSHLGACTFPEWNDRASQTGDVAQGTFEHICSDIQCPYDGKPSVSSCRCHKSAEQMMRERIAYLEAHLAAQQPPAPVNGWIHLKAKRVLSVDRGETTILCDRDIPTELMILIEQPPAAPVETCALGSQEMRAAIQRGCDVVNEQLALHRLSADIVDALARTIWLAGFERAFSRTPTDPWENQAESAKAPHINTARKIIEAGFVTGAPAQAAPELPSLVDRSELVALLQDLASVNLSREACERQARRMADDLIARGLTLAAQSTAAQVETDIDALTGCADDLGAFALSCSAGAPVESVNKASIERRERIQQALDDGKPVEPVQRCSAATGEVRTFEISGTTFRRVGKVLTITCDSDEIANRVSDQLRTEPQSASEPAAIMARFDEAIKAIKER